MLSETISKQTKTLCKNCNLAPVYSRERCGACYKYRQRHDAERPAVLFAPRSANCNVLPKDGVNGCIICGWGEIRASGRCMSCYMYLRDHGVERPENLWASTRLCDCDLAPITRTIEVIICPGGEPKSTRIPVCDQCYAVAMEMQAHLTRHANWGDLE
jgi:hypothetical protein